MAKNLERDESGELEKYVVQCIKNEVSLVAIQHIRFLYVWYIGESPELDEEKMWVMASVRKLPVRERDVFGVDVELKMNRSLWEDSTTEQKKRTIWHELKHIYVHLDESMNIEYDNDGRISFHMARHDVVIKTFEEELEKFGLPRGAEYSSKLIATAYRNTRREKNGTKKEKIRKRKASRSSF